MADTSYVEKVYRRQEGDVLVVADHGELVVESGGLLSVESGGEINVESGGAITYQSGSFLNVETGAQIDVETGASLDVESGGDIDLESGGHLDVESGGVVHLESAGSLLRFFSAEDYTATQISALMRSMTSLELTNHSTAGTTLSTLGGSQPTVIPSTIGILQISCSAGLVAGSMRLFSGVTGQTLKIRFVPDMAGAHATITIYTSIGGISGVKIFGSARVEISTLLLKCSTNSQASVELLCIKDGSWAIKQSSATQVTEQPAA